MSHFAKIAGRGFGRSRAECWGRFGCFYGCFYVFGRVFLCLLGLQNFLENCKKSDGFNISLGEDLLGMVCFKAFARSLVLLM